MTNLKVHLCCIAKNEELYIENWMLHYYSLGIDFIYIYDNNNIDKKPSLSEFLSNSKKLKKHKNKFKIITWNGLQNHAYKNCWNRFFNDFDWLLICDIDEFIDIQSVINFNASNILEASLENTKDNTLKNNIKSLLEHYKDSKLLSLRCIEYGDNELIERNMSKPVYKVFTKKASKIYDLFYKSFFNRHLIKNFRTYYGHVLSENNKKFSIDYQHKYHFINFNDNNILENEPFIRHIRTYSLKEYLDQKYRVKHQSINGNIRRYLLSQYYFKINQWTEEKQKYIEEYRKKNNIIRTLYCCSETIYEKYKDILKDKCCYVYEKRCKLINVMKSDFKFEGINQLIEIIYDFDNIVFL